MRLRFLLTVAAVLVALSAAARAEELKKVKLAYGGQVLNISYPWLELPDALG